MGSVLVLLAWLQSCPAPAAVCEPAMSAAQSLADTMDMVAVTSSARKAQANFERQRIGYLPVNYDGFGGDCDEVIGRICTTYSEGEWYPDVEHEEIVRMRRRLLQYLDSTQKLVPSSDWILGQRVWYRVEAGDLGEALMAAVTCGRAQPWWCSALRGFALHNAGDYRNALGAFEEALARMDPDQAEQWRVPRWPVDSKTRDLLHDTQTEPGTASTLLKRFWMLADPLYLAPGNDRLTEHYARWTASQMRATARNPFLLGWGSDLSQLTIRNGWEMGWERRLGSNSASNADAVGHMHPEGRDFMPPAEALKDTDGVTVEDMRADRKSPRSLYAPAYAPVFLPMEGQLAVFPRGLETAVVASHFLPEDTTFHSGHEHPLPWMETGPYSDEPDRIGLFLLSPDGELLDQSQKLGGTDGALMVEARTGPLVVSAESWAPERRRAGRMRIRMAERRTLEDIATLSDLLLLAPSAASAKRLEQAVPHALPQARILAGEPIAIGWEVSGLGFRPETLRFRISVERIDQSVFRRIGQFLGLASRPRPLELSWDEAAPAVPGHEFHFLSLNLPSLDNGRYEIRLVLSTVGRSDAESTAVFQVTGTR